MIVILYHIKANNINIWINDGQLILRDMEIKELNAAMETGLADITPRINGIYNKYSIEMSDFELNQCLYAPALIPKQWTQDKDKINSKLSLISSLLSK